MFFLMLSVILWSFHMNCSTLVFFSDFKSRAENGFSDVLVYPNPSSHCVTGGCQITRVVNILHVKKGIYMSTI